jgi:hypothetical protein
MEQRLDDAENVGRQPFQRRNRRSYTLGVAKFNLLQEVGHLF